MVIDDHAVMSSDRPNKSRIIIMDTFFVCYLSCTHRLLRKKKAKKVNFSDFFTRLKVSEVTVSNRGSVSADSRAAKPQRAAKQ